MKKLLLIPMFLLWTVSCTSNEADIQCEKDNSLVEIVQKYEYYKNNAQLQINETLSKLEGVDTRSEISTQISGMDLVNYLSNLSSAVVDSLYNIYCTVQAQEEYDEAYDAIITLLIENSSFEEVQALFNFTRLYIECGGKICQ